MEQKDKTRSGEEHTVAFRSGRFYSVGNDWYFSVRELDDQGPFSSRENAELGLRVYLSDAEQFTKTKDQPVKRELKLS